MYRTRDEYSSLTIDDDGFTIVSDTTLNSLSTQLDYNEEQQSPFGNRVGFHDFGSKLKQI